MPRQRDIRYRGKNQIYKGHVIKWYRYKELEYFCGQYLDYKAKYSDCYYKSSPPTDGQPKGNGIGHPTES
ncbi:MAG: hypothetical protein RR385_09785, partial [Clostridiales bacterium]